MVSVFWEILCLLTTVAMQSRTTQTLQNLGLYKMEEKLEGLVHGQEEEEEEEL
jgi:hypothetical protein